MVVAIFDPSSGEEEEGGEEKENKEVYSREVQMSLGDSQDGQQRHAAPVSAEVAGHSRNCWKLYFPKQSRRLNYLQSECEGGKPAVCKTLFSCLLGKALEENVQSSEEMF